MCLCFLCRCTLNGSFHCRSVPTPAYQWPASPILPPISSRTPHLVPETLVPNTSSSASLMGPDFGFPKPSGGPSWIELQESPSRGGSNGGAINSSNDWRMVRMYELMEDFEEVLSRAPISISGQEPILSVGGRNISNSIGCAVTTSEKEGEDDNGEGVSSSKSRKQQISNHDCDDSTVFAAGNCLSSNCCYTSSSTESDTVRADHTKATSKYKKQRERVLSRPTLEL